ncbi:hypothetical protein ABTY96_28430 [Streptomyces sp. NPDC096057]|uniref:hypothetical protein n=1 Tax=Streptomyces sp. NPDC096057 TaxID=3155543 RepID=UPI00331FDC14
MIDTKGTPCSFVVAGDRAHHFAMPRDLGMLPPKVAKAYEKLTDAARAAQELAGKNGGDRAARTEANDTVRAALAELYDQAAATTKAARELYDEQFEYALRRFARAIEDAQNALQGAVTAAQLFDQAANGHAVGLNPGLGTKSVMFARAASETLEKLPKIPALGEK